MRGVAMTAPTTCFSSMAVPAPCTTAMASLPHSPICLLCPHLTSISVWLHGYPTFHDEEAATQRTRGFLKVIGSG